jgi:predicted DNA-binding transcriptional regulator AlpA
VVSAQTPAALQLDTEALEALIARIVEATLERLGRASGNGHAAKPAGELLTQPESWRYCGLSRSVWFRLKAAGKLPSAVGSATRNPRWRRSDLQRWVEHLKPIGRRSQQRRK